MFYSVAHPELMDLLGAADQLLALTGEAVERCPNYGPPATLTDSHPESRIATKETAICPTPAAAAPTRPEAMPASWRSRNRNGCGRSASCGSPPSPGSS